MKSFWKFLFRVFLWLVGVVLAINVAILIYADSYLVSPVETPKATYGMILGASVYRNGTLSDILRDRVDTALAVYKQGGFKRFFISGDDSEGHGEIKAIVTYLHDQWISDEIITSDGAGFDTYDSMRRAKTVYNVDSILIFTQAFHLSRSVYIARRLGISSYGIVTDKQPYLREVRFMFREIGARVKAFLDVELLKSSPRQSG